MNHSSRKPAPNRRFAAAAKAAAIAFGLLTGGGCQTLEQMAPPVDEVFAALGEKSGHAATTLHHGRELYIIDCASCHTVEPVDGYSLKQWEKILPEMTAETKLTRMDAADLEAYVRTAHEFLRQQKSGSSISSQSAGSTPASR